MLHFRYTYFVFVVIIVFIEVTVLYAEDMPEHACPPLTIVLDENEYAPEIARHHPSFHVLLIADNEDILAQIESLKEQSKPALEPVIREYMLAVEALTRLAASQKREQGSEQQKQALRARFYSADTKLTTILAGYRQQIDDLLQQNTVQTLVSLVSSDPLLVAGIPSGKYRIYGRVMFATTTFHWFEPVIIQGGECRTMTLTRENMTNPYWTDLNWWSFMNLDFSKHHCTISDQSDH